MTPPDATLREIRERLAKATPGPWGVNDQDVTGVWRIKYPGKVYPSFVGGFYKGRADAELAAHAPDDLAYLLARLAKAEARLAYRDAHVKADDALRLHLEQRLAQAEAVCATVEKQRAGSPMCPLSEDILNALTSWQEGR